MQWFKEKCAVRLVDGEGKQERGWTRARVALRINNASQSQLLVYIYAHYLNINSLDIYKRHQVPLSFPAAADYRVICTCFAHYTATTGKICQIFSAFVRKKSNVFFFNLRTKKFLGYISNVNKLKLALKAYG